MRYVTTDNQKLKIKMQNSSITDFFKKSSSKSKTLIENNEGNYYVLKII